MRFGAADALPVQSGLTTDDEREMMPVMHVARTHRFAISASYPATGAPAGADALVLCIQMNIWGRAL
jgi:hypothetical protein